jgi:UDP-2-acetamido-3-amino-2,3-dideoxy-glucuronate N-acetyltransferase
LLDDGEHRRQVTLDRPNLGIFMPAMVWGRQFNYSADAVLLVFASLPYDPADYIRTYEEFRALVAQ